MGINVSKHADLANNEYLLRFVGREHIPYDDTAFWNNLLNFHMTMPENSQDQLNLDSRLETLCQSFISNNLKTGNFGSLITVFLHKAAELLSLSDQESSLHIWQTFNALFIIRTLIKYLIETGSEFQLLQHFEAIPNVELLNKEETASSQETTIAVEDNEQPTTTTKSVPAITVDNAKFETFLDAIVNLIVVIPVK